MTFGLDYRFGYGYGHIYGYGFGLRSRILGYFVRADWAWGVDDGVVLPAVFYFSLSLDF